MSRLALSEETTLPDDGFAGALAARVWRPDARRTVGLRRPARRRLRRQRRLSDHARSVRGATRRPRRCARRRASGSASLGGDPRTHARATRRATDRPRLLAPVDLQAIKAAGVTFAQSLLERVIEERARGSREGAATARDEIAAVLGEELGGLSPARPRRCGSRRRWSRPARGRNILKSASARTRRSSPRASRCRRSAAATTRVSTAASHWNNPGAGSRARRRLDGTHRRRDARQ